LIVILNVIMLSVVMLSVMAPQTGAKPIMIVSKIRQNTKRRIESTWGRIDKTFFQIGQIR